MKNTIKTIFCLLMLIATVGYGQAQPKATLGIGDAAPALKYSKWIKGSPIDQFKDDHTYIVEFWATWCGPCIGQMPHLSELADKYKGKVTIIGAGVWEKTGDKPYETSLPNVVRFVEGNSKNMRYEVLADTKDQFISNNWLKPAGINGIPTTFIIQKNKIVWIGHPAELDQIIDPILAGTYDIAAYKAKYDAANEASAKASQKDAEKYRPLTTAMEAKDYNRVIVVIDSLSQLSVEDKSRLTFARMDAILRVRKHEALTAANEMLKNSPRSGPNLALSISQHDGLPKELYQLGIEQLKSLDPMMSLALNAIALLQSKIGDFAGAAETQQKAIELVKVELKDPKFSGRVFEHTITDYQKQLEEYKNKMK